MKKVRVTVNVKELAATVDQLADRLEALEAIATECNKARRALTKRVEAALTGLQDALDREVSDLDTAIGALNDRLDADDDHEAVNTEHANDVVPLGEHTTHGRGTEKDGPDDSDCPCRSNAEKRGACAEQGCGFCKADETRLRSGPVNPVEG